MQCTRGHSKRGHWAIQVEGRCMLCCKWCKRDYPACIFARAKRPPLFTFSFTNRRSKTQTLNDDVLRASEDDAGARCEYRDFNPEDVPPIVPPTRRDGVGVTQPTTTCEDGRDFFFSTKKISQSQRSRSRSKRKRSLSACANRSRPF